MSPRQSTDDGLRVLISDQSLSRRGFLLSSLAVAGGAALAGLPLDDLTGAEAATGGSLTSLTYSGQRWGFVQKALIPAFSAQTHIKVNLITFPVTQGYGRILNAMAVGSSEYDLIDLDYGILAEVAHSLVPLNPYLKREPAFTSDYASSVPPNVRGLYRFDGKRLGGGTTYGIAHDSNTQLGFYRADIFSKHGIAKPATTWDEVLPIAKELTYKTTQGQQYGFTTNGKRGVYSSTWFGNMLLSYGGYWLDAHNRPTLTTPEAHAALEMIKKLMKYADPSVVNSADNETINAMASGVAVYAPNAWGNNAFTNPKLNKYGHVTKGVIVPKGSGPKAKHAPLMGGFGFVIPAASKHQAEAWQFIKYLTAKRNMKAYVGASGQPARTDALRKYANVAEMFTALAESLPHGVAQPGWLRGQQAFYEALGTQVSLVMTGQKSVSAALKQAQADCTAALKQSGDIR